MEVVQGERPRVNWWVVAAVGLLTAGVGLFFYIPFVTGRPDLAVCPACGGSERHRW